MQLSTLQKTGGIALIAGSLFLTAYSLMFFTLLPMNGLRGDMTIAILNPNWRLICLAAFAGLPLMMFGFTAVYSRMFQTAGFVGLLGYILVELAYLFQTCKVTWELCLYPVIARHQAAAVLIRDSILRHSAEVSMFRSAATLSIFLGIVLFCLSIILSKKYSLWSGLLIFIGAFLYGLGPIVSIWVAMGGIIILSVGCFLLGSSLMGKGD